CAIQGISPGLDNVGAFLPYSGMHHLLFGKLDSDALIMTSANPPGEPMTIDDASALEMGADGYLLHDQEIVNRADDSVMRMFNGRTQYIRRSRGAVPYSIRTGVDGDVVALGAQENLTASVAHDGRIWPTQYIGNGERIGVIEYLEDAVRMQTSLLGAVPRAVAVDLHKGYSNRRLASELASETGAGIVEVQHHWAHTAALMADNGIDECVALALDGTGLGDDGTAWGGEVLHSTFEGYRRVAHLQRIPLIGGEKAVHDIRRLRFAYDVVSGREPEGFTDMETELFRKMAPKSVLSSSMGRFLDAISYTAGSCSARTYDGEPAMRLEPLLSEGKSVPGFETYLEGDTLMVSHMFEALDESADRASAAHSMVEATIEGLVGVAVDEARSHGIDAIGLTGGVSYSSPITRMFVEAVRSAGMTPVLHRDVPNGDCGISVGQAAIAVRSLQ
ncbi:MAG: carbamoyltransferase HypF, partial [Candidatus Methanomethylophilaceae archaeon]|nr:carbamoyltransferase HypF [Candidatus Methanomethylophilaceae archaeon]